MDDTELEALLEVVLRPERPRSAPEERMQAIEDRQAIHELIMSYGYLCDAQRWDELLDLYTDDIERTLGGTLTEHVQGKAALREKLEAPTLARKSGEGGPPPTAVMERFGIRHLMAGEVIRLADHGLTATAAVQYSLVVSLEGEAGFRKGAHEGSYVFDFRKENGVWKFCRQFVISDNAHNPLFQADAQ